MKKLLLSSLLLMSYSLVGMDANGFLPNCMRNSNTLWDAAGKFRNLGLVKNIVNRNEPNYSVNAKCIEKNGVTPLIQAVYWNNYDIVRFLITHGADVNLQDYSGRSPLSYAYQGENTDIIRLLSANGALNKGWTHAQIFGTCMALAASAGLILRVARDLGIL